MKRQALILGAEPRVAVTIARSLHRRGIAVTVAALSSEESRVSSRAVRNFIRLPGLGEKPQKFRTAVSELIAGQQYDILIPSNDTALTVVADYYESLQTQLHVGCPHPAIVKRVLEKNATLEVAVRCGIPIPPTYNVADEAELDRLISTLRFPIIAKPRTKTEMGMNDFKVRCFHAAGALREAFHIDPSFGRRYLLQAYCVGEGVGIAMLMHHGESLATFQHRRLKEFPHTGGVGVVTISESPDPALVKHSLALLRALEWEGVAMVEFRHNRANQEAALMEVNGRYWGSLSTAVHAGMDFPFYEWQLAHGEWPVIPPIYPAGIRVRWMTGDFLRLHALFLEPRTGGLPIPSAWRELAGFIAGFRPSIQSACWSLTDPMPALLEFRGAAKAVLLRDAKALVRRLIPRSVVHHIRRYRLLGRRERSAYLKLQVLRALRLRRDHSRRLPARVRSILFVCHGNIIRSPIAAAMLRRTLAEMERATIVIASAGLHARPDRGVDERAQVMAREFEVSLDDHRAQLLTSVMVDQSDAIFVMDYLNEAEFLTLYPKAGTKVFMLGGFAKEAEVHEIEIPDPYNGDAEDVRSCFQILRANIGSLSRKLFPTAQEKFHFRDGIDAGSKSAVVGSGN